MGRLSNDAEQYSSPKGVKVQHKTNRSWQLLFVDDRGKIVSYAWFKNTAIIALSVLLLSIVCAITLSFFFIKNRNENIELKEGLEASESRMKALQNEKDILLARLVLTESKIKAVSDQNTVLKQMPVEAEKNVQPDNSAGKKELQQ